MSKQKVKTTPDLSINSEVHQTAIKAGKEHFYSYQYNVVDKFKDKTTEEIKTELKNTAFPYAILMENILGDYNFATMIRNANAFNAREVFYTGTKRFNKVGAMGTHNYTDVHFISTIDDLLKLKEKYKFIGVDNITGAVSIKDYEWRANSLLIFGSEGVGLTPGMQELCDELVYIQQHGSVRSLNAGCASAVIMNSFVNKFKG